MLHILLGLTFGPKPTTSTLKVFKSRGQFSKNGKNGKILTFKVNFLYQKLSKLSEIDNFYSSDRKTQKLFNGLVVDFGPTGMPGRMYNIVR